MRLRLVLVFAAGLAIGIGVMAVGSVAAQTTPSSPVTTTGQPTLPSAASPATPVALSAPATVTAVPGGAQPAVSPEEQAPSNGMQTVPLSSVIPPDVPRASDGYSLNAQPFAVQQQFVQVWGVQAWQEWANERDVQIRGGGAPASTPAPASAPGVTSASPTATSLAPLPALPGTTTTPSVPAPLSPVATGSAASSTGLVAGTPTPAETGP